MELITLIIHNIKALGFFSSHVLNKPNFCYQMRVPYKSTYFIQGSTKRGPLLKNLSEQIVKHSGALNI